MKDVENDLEHPLRNSLSSTSPSFLSKYHSPQNTRTSTGRNGKIGTLFVIHDQRDCDPRKMFHAIDNFGIHTPSRLQNRYETRFNIHTEKAIASHANVIDVRMIHINNPTKHPSNNFFLSFVVVLHLSNWQNRLSIIHARYQCQLPSHDCNFSLLVWLCRTTGVMALDMLTHLSGWYFGGNDQGRWKEQPTYNVTGGTRLLAGKHD